MAYIGSSLVGSDRSSSFLSTAALDVLTTNLVKERDYLCPTKLDLSNRAKDSFHQPQWLIKRLSTKKMLDAKERQALQGDDDDGFAEGRREADKRNKIAGKIGNQRTNVVQDQTIREYDEFFARYKSANRPATTMQDEGAGALGSSNQLGPSTLRAPWNDAGPPSQPPTRHSARHHRGEVPGAGAQPHRYDSLQPGLFNPQRRVVQHLESTRPPFAVRVCVDETAPQPTTTTHADYRVSTFAESSVPVTKIVGSKHLKPQGGAWQGPPQDHYKPKVERDLDLPRLKKSVVEKNLDGDAMVDAFGIRKLGVSVSAPFGLTADERLITLQAAYTTGGGATNKASRKQKKRLDIRPF